MQAYEVLQEAAALVEAGWSQGAVARDASGRPVPLFTTGSSETGRAAINPEAAQLSLYGAISKAQAPGGVIGLPAMWDLLAVRCADLCGPTGGDNHLHPVMLFNETEGRTKADVVALLLTCVIELTTGAKVAPPIASPPVTVIEQSTEVVVDPKRMPVTTERVALGPNPSLREERPPAVPTLAPTLLDRVGPNPFGGPEGQQ